MLTKKEQELLNIFSERIAFHDTERMLYSSDVSNLPAFVKRQIKANPDAVVQPESQNELIALVDLAGRYGTPLVPRGSGTAGYGGAVPCRGGIVVDFHRMCRIIDINAAQKTVTVEGGAVLGDVEKQLRERGLALRLYPSSAISATVAGWLANGGGVGIGSYEYGRFRDNILKFTLVTSKGSREFTGDDLDLVDGMAGTTGLISQITLLAREGEGDVPVLGAFRRMEDLLTAWGEIKREGLALWHAGYKDPSIIKLNRKATEKGALEHPGHGGKEGPALPDDKILATFAYPESRKTRIAERLLDIIRTQGGEVLDAEMANYEWNERFYPMRLKALGPSMIQSEAIIPTRELPSRR